MKDYYYPRARLVCNEKWAKRHQTLEEEMKRINLLLWVVALSVPLSAQNPTSAQLDAMKKLDFLVGQWKGEGWISFGPGQRRTFTQTETIEPKLGGLL